jgi:ppGpp synthetase/RelA/SpoT-type nucleotidyltranferase
MVWIDNPFQSNPHLLSAVNPRGLLASLLKLCEPYQSAHQVAQDIVNNAVDRTQEDDSSTSYDIVTERFRERTEKRNSKEDLSRFMNDMGL